MKRMIVVALLVLTGAAAIAQTAPKQPEYGWKNTMVAGLNLTQISLNNWTAGGENSIAWTVVSSGKFLYSAESYTWTTNLKIAYGQTKLGSKDFEKTDDEFFLESIYAFLVGWKIDPYVAASVRTQMSPSYKDVKGVRTKYGDLFDPGYVIESAGFTYALGETFSTRLGLAVKETFTHNFPAYADDPKTTKIEKTRVQTGIESGSSLKVDVMENVLYTSQLNLFSAFNSLDVWDVRWDNTLAAKVNSYVNVSLNVQLVHEIAQTRRTQLKEMLALGLNYTLF